MRAYWLDGPHGRVMIGAWAVLVGRSPDCNIILEGSDISRHHLLVRRGSEGAELLPLGRTPVRVNGTARTRLTPLAEGDRVEVAAWSAVLGAGEVAALPRAVEVAWLVERAPGVSQLIDGSRALVGGSDADDIIVEGWAPAVLRFERAGDAMFATALRADVWCGRALSEGERVAVADGARIRYGSTVLGVRARSVQACEATTGDERPAAAVFVLLEFEPRGAQLTVEIGGRLHTTRLSDRRSDLVACLLQPPAPYRAGELVPEEVLCARVWPGEERGRTELNSLLYRLREALADDGIDPAPLFERRAGALRFCLAPRARVVVR